MAKPVLMRKRAKIVALIVFLLALIIITFLGTWWPGIMLAVGLPLAILQYLQGRMYDMCVSLFVFVGAFITVQFNIKWEIFLPVLFAIGGIYIFFREFIYSRSEEEEKMEEDKDESSKE
ncbi:MAG: hypothetical protein P0S96_04975 [Simkaniaceae bacterium]|nr:hypothetical protein [Candidatus Sacchlamyda saccharinae]